MLLEEIYRCNDCPTKNVMGDLMLCSVFDSVKCTHQGVLNKIRYSVQELNLLNPRSQRLLTSVATKANCKASNFGHQQIVVQLLGVASDAAVNISRRAYCNCRAKSAFRKKSKLSLPSLMNQMVRWDLDFMGVQKTKLKGSDAPIKDKVVTFFYSGGPLASKERMHAGVGLLVRNKWVAGIEKVFINLKGFVVNRLF
jgi:hypothetical protein